MAQSIYMRGQGRLKVAQYDTNGILGGYRFVGSCPMLKLDPKTTFIEHREDITGSRYKDLKIVDTSELMVSFTLDVGTIDNYSLGFFGDVTTDAGIGTFTSVLPTVVVGLDYKFGRAGYVVTTVTDSAATPATIPATSYTVNKDGTLTFNNVGTFVQPFNVAGTKAPSSSVAILSRPTSIIALMFEGLNTADGRKGFVVDIPRISLNPAKSYDIIGSTLSKMELDGEAIFDANSIGTGPLTGFGSITKV